MIRNGPATVHIARGVFTGMWIRIAICDAIWANCESNVKLIRNFANQKLTKACNLKILIHMNFAKETTDLTLYLIIINDLRPISRTTVTFKMLSVVMWYLIRAAVKNVRINLGQLRIKHQIDSQLCDLIFAVYVQA